jgi:hypothetical protein
VSFGIVSTRTLQIWTRVLPAVDSLRAIHRIAVNMKGKKVGKEKNEGGVST